MKSAPDSAPLQSIAETPARADEKDRLSWYRLYSVFRTVARTRKTDTCCLSLALCAVPISIAVAEFFLAGSLIFRVIAIGRHQKKIYLPRVFWLWLVWAVLEAFAWVRSPEIRPGQGEMRHLVLIATLFVVVPALNSVADRVAVWRGIIFTATVNSVVLLANFLSRLFFYQGNLDPVIYLRGGGLLHHWMIYGTVEVMVFAGLLSLWQFYPEERFWLLPACAINIVAIVVSLTRMLWICCLLLLALHLIWTRSRWSWAVPLIPCFVFILAPAAVRSRIVDSARPAYYSNAERLQMLRVGLKIVREKPLTGVGPGRINEVYAMYLSPGDPVPTYHGHLHNNLVQVAAEFGLPVVAASLVFVASLFLELRARRKVAANQDEAFLCRTSLLGLTGFIAAGMFDYTYGHSLGLILLGFVVLSPLVPEMGRESEACVVLNDRPARPGGSALAVTDRILGLIIIAALSPVIVAATTVTYLLSRRSPFVAHLRIGQHGRAFWIWKIRTMWPAGPPHPSERVWLQRIEADPVGHAKLEHDPRVTSRFAALCRRHSIDELPQLLQVVRGDMSLVGPRPVTRGELASHYGARAEEILRVKPGLTGYWQTRGRNRLSYYDRVQLDLALIEDLSLSVYLEVLFKTIPEVLIGKNAW